MDANFAATLNQAIRDQAALPWDADGYDAALDALFARASPGALAARSQTRMRSVSQNWRPS